MFQLVEENLTKIQMNQKYWYDRSTDTGNASPIHHPPYRVPHVYRDSVKAELDKMLERGIIEPSSSQWAAPLVLVKKKDSTLRLCVDYRHLNNVSRVDAYLMPCIDDLLDHLGKAKFISTMDLTRGYWQVPVAEKDRSLSLTLWF